MTVAPDTAGRPVDATGSPPRRGSARAYVAREAAISGAINGVLSLVAMTVVFGRAATIPIWGFGNYAFDTLPQSFIVALMSTLVPGLIAERKRRAGAVEPLVAPPSRWPRRLAARVPLAALASAVLGTAIVAAALAASGLTHLAWSTAALLKMGYGAALGYGVTRATLPASLGDRQTRRSRR